PVLRGALPEVAQPHGLYCRPEATCHDGVFAGGAVMVFGTTGAVAPDPTVIPGLVPGIQASTSAFARSLARRLRLATVAFADRWIPATSAGMTSNLRFNRQAKRWVIPGLVPRIQVSANALAGSLARRLRLVTVAFADRWIPATSAGMTSNLRFNGQANRRVLPGVVPGIQVSANAFAGSLARRLRLASVAFADRWIPATSAG